MGGFYLEAMSKTAQTGRANRSKPKKDNGAGWITEGPEEKRSL
jgi:hypothetical protein